MTDPSGDDGRQPGIAINGDAGAQGEGAPGGEYDERRPANEEAYGTDPESDRDLTAEGRSSTGDARG